MKTELANARKKLNQLQGKRELLIGQRAEVLHEKEKWSTFYDNAVSARAVVQIVAEETQKSLEYHISNLVTAALTAVFDEPYTFSLRFVQRRNKTEADLVFDKSGNQTDDLINTAGGGVVDVASFALRIALWSIKRTRPVMIIDEAFRFLSLDLQEKASEMIKEISSKLGIQVIMVSHLPLIVASADRIINIEHSTENGSIVSYQKK